MNWSYHRRMELWKTHKIRDPSQVKFEVRLVDFLLVDSKVAERDTLAAVTKDLHQRFNSHTRSAQMVAVSFAEGVAAEMALYISNSGPLVNQLVQSLDCQPVAIGTGKDVLVRFWSRL